MSQDTASTPTRPRRSKKQTIASLLLGVIILCCGGIIGSGITLHYLWGRLMTGIHNPSPEAAQERLMNRMDHMLDLSDEQQTRVREILREEQPVFMALRADFFPRLDTALEELHATIGKELNPEQKETWDARFDHLQGMFIPEQYRGEESTP